MCLSHCECPFFCTAPAQLSVTAGLNRKKQTHGSLRSGSPLGATNGDKRKREKLKKEEKWLENVKIGNRRGNKRKNGSKKKKKW